MGTNLKMTQGANVLDVIKDDTVNVLSEYADKKDHVHRAKTRITSKFFTVTSGSNPDTIKVTGTADIAFKTGGRRLAESGRSLQNAQQPQPQGKFSFDINLAPSDSGDTSVDDVSAAIAQLLGVPLAA